VVDELLVENMYRNPDGNPLIFDSILLDKVIAEKNIQLLLNTSVYEVAKISADKIESVTAFCSQNSTQYILGAPLFCDASGDGIVGFLSGAAFRMGAEGREEFDEKFAPDQTYGELLGHSMYFYSKDTGKPVKYVAPDFALTDITRIPRFKSFNTQEYGCKLWWLEYGGRLDTVHDTEKIKWELWKVVYGTWDYIKNSGNFPEAENLTLEWVSTIPGKRESRRFEGDYMLNQKDIVEQRAHADAVAYGGWSIDLHPADGVFSEKPGCNQWHSKGIYQIPYRCLYSKNISNLFLAGRIISASHVAFASSRVMATSAYVAQAVGMAAKLCRDHLIEPAAIITGHKIKELQNALMIAGQYIPGLRLLEKEDLVQTAVIKPSSELQLSEMTKGSVFVPLTIASAQLIPLEKGAVPRMIFYAETDEVTALKVELRSSSKPGNFTPDGALSEQIFMLKPGINRLQTAFDCIMETPQYGFLVFEKHPLVKLQFTAQRITGMLSVFNLVNKAVSNYGKQTPDGDIGVDEFEFWCPQRRPEGLNMALAFEPPLNMFLAENVRNGTDRPVLQPNAWVAAYKDFEPSLTFEWQKRQKISTIQLVFDTDVDHPMESVLMAHPENVMPFCVRDFYLMDDKGRIVYEKRGNYQTRHTIRLPKPLLTKKLTVYVQHPSLMVPAALFAVRCYA